MKHTFTALFLFLVITVQAQVPQITGLSTYAATPGTTITINGQNFQSFPPDNIVYFGGVKADVLPQSTSTQLMVVVPTGATFRPVTVTANGLTAYSPQPFTVISKTNQALSAGTFAPLVVFGTGDTPVGLNMADYDGDRKPDYSMTTFDPSRLAFYRNTSTKGVISNSSLAAPIGMDAAWGNTASDYADMDGDGDLDFLALNNSQATLAIYRNTASPGNMTTASLTPIAFINTADSPFDVGVGDFNSDGKPDIVVTGARLGVAINRTTDRRFITIDPPTYYLLPAAARHVAVADIDMNGKQDLVVTCPSAGLIIILLNTSEGSNTSFVTGPTLQVGGDPFSLAVGDLDRDGKPDIAVGRRAASNIAIFRNTSGAELSFAPPISLSCSTPNGVTMGELDGDGKLDLAVANYLQAGQVTVFKNISTPGQLAPTDFPAFIARTGSFAHDVVIGDMDGDERADLSVIGINQLNVFRNASAPVVESLVTSPADGSVGVDPDLEIQVSPVEGAATYTVQLSRAPTFQVVDFEQTSTTPGIAFSELEYKTSYYARVFTNLASDPGPVSSFTTRLPDVYVTSPANGETGISNTTTIRTNLVPGASSYTIQLSKSPGFSTIAFQSTSAERTARVEGLAYNTTYYTRVYTNLSAQHGEIRSFTTRSAESITYVYDPSDGATSVSVDPAITTTLVPGATSYTVQLSESPDFAVIDFEGSSADRRVSFSGLKYGTTYYNRVITDVSPTPGPVRSFATTSASSLAYVSTPGDGAIQVPLTVNIKANLVPGATSYTIQLSLTPDFTSIAFENTSANRVMPFSGLAYNTTYYNRVITDVSSDPGPVRSFTTATPDAVTYVLSPADGEVDVDVPVRIISIIVADASSYTIQLSETPDFSVVAFEKSSTNRKIKFNDLLAGTTYFVRVKTDLSSEFGKVTSFTTRPTEGFAARMRAGAAGARISTTVTPADNAIAFADRFEVDVYPNPFMERVSVIASDPETKALSVKVVDMAGKEMHKIDGITNTRYEFGETLPAGAYVILLRTNTDMRVVRVIKRE